MDAEDEDVIAILDGLVVYAQQTSGGASLAYDDLQVVFCRPASMTPNLSPRFPLRAAEDFMPTRERDMIEYMELLAVYEASNRRLLPAFQRHSSR